MSLLRDIDLAPIQVNLQRLIELLQVKGRTRGFDLSSAVVPTIDVGQILELASQKPGLLSPFNQPFVAAPPVASGGLPTYALGFEWFKVNTIHTADITDSEVAVGPLVNNAGFAPTTRALVRVAAIGFHVTFTAAGQQFRGEFVGNGVLEFTPLAPVITLAHSGLAGTQPRMHAMQNFTPALRALPHGGEWIQVIGNAFVPAILTSRGGTVPAPITIDSFLLAQIAPAID